MSDPIAPLFVLSLPRAGSTLVQRVLAVHPDVATASEPWVLLPLLGALRPLPQGGRWQAEVAGALGDFAGVLPGGVERYRAVMRDAALALYREAAGPGPRFFLDKSPPYALLADELLTAFPTARVLFLWRHPLAVVSSLVETFRGGRWRPDDYAVSLFAGLDALVAAYTRHEARAVAVRFEDLIGGGAERWRALAAALDVPFDERALERFAEIRLDGRFGDATGVRAYRELAHDPLAKWRQTVGASPIRRAWCRRYLHWIGCERLAVMGYELDDLLRELDALGPPALGAARRDALDVARTLTRDALRAQLPGARGTPSSWRQLLSAR